MNIARGQEASINRVCELVLEKLGCRHLEPLYQDDGRPGDVNRHWADVTKASKILGFCPTTDLEEGIDRYIEWIRRSNLDLERWAVQDKIQNW